MTPVKRQRGEGAEKSRESTTTQDLEAAVISGPPNRKKKVGFSVIVGFLLEKKGQMRKGQ